MSKASDVMNVTKMLLGIDFSKKKSGYLLIEDYKIPSEFASL